MSPASSVTQEHAFVGGPKIVAIETSTPADLMPGLLALRIHTDAGSVDQVPVVGHGETYYVPSAVAAVIHDWMAPRLLGSDAGAIESHWRFLYERMTAFGGVGAELRALSAIDLALWDIAGQLAQQPVWRLLGGPVRSAVPVYNSCGGPTYGATSSAGSSAVPSGGSWPGHGDLGQPGPYQDNWASMNQPAELAEELLADGFTAMKMWSFDAEYRATGGQRISPAAVDRGVAPFHAIRDRVGDRMDLMLDGHGFFSVRAGLDITRALRDVRPLWVEDVIRPDNLEAMVEFRRGAGVPVAVSEMLVTRAQYQHVLAHHAADYVMIDPTWVGGISETRRIAELAQVHNVPVLMHDCTGPFTLLAGLTVATANSGVTYQECVRAHLATLYPRLVDTEIAATDGTIALDHRPGLGARWLPGLFEPDRTGYRVTRLEAAP